MCFVLARFVQLGKDLKAWKFRISNSPNSPAFTSHKIFSSTTKARKFLLSIIKQKLSLYLRLLFLLYILAIKASGAIRGYGNL